MARLFVAIDFPDEIVSALAAIQPKAGFGIRPTSRDQLHLTLHFLGECDSERISRALSTLKSPAIELTIEGVGSFKSRDGGAIVWAGIQANAALKQLHQSVTSVLRPEGFHPESRPYSPHITLARCTAAVPQNFVNAILREHANLRLPDIPIRQMKLYSSTLSNHGSVYQCELTIPLPQELNG